MKTIAGIRCLAFLVGAVGAISVSAAADPTDVSMVALLAAPSQFDGKLVRVAGFVRFEFEGNRICLHREDSISYLYKNCFWLSAELGSEKRQAVSDRYAIAVGTFNAKSKGHLGLFSGTLEKVTALDAWDVK